MRADVGDPVAVNGLFGCVVGYDPDAGHAIILLADRSGMPGSLVSAEPEVAVALRDGFLRWCDTVGIYEGCGIVGWIEGGRRC